MTSGQPLRKFQLCTNNQLQEVVLGVVRLELDRTRCRGSRGASFFLKEKIKRKRAAIEALRAESVSELVSRSVGVSDRLRGKDSRCGKVRVAVVDGRVMFDGFGRKRVQIRTSRKQICSRVAQSVCRVAQAASRFAQAASRFARAASRVAQAASSVVIFGGDVPGPRRLLFLWQWF